MQPFLVAARAAHFAGAISLAGVFAFALVVAMPAYRRAAVPVPAALQRGLRLVAWCSFGLAAATLPLWLLATAQNMDAAAGPVLLHTQFGRVLMLRVALMLAAGTCIPFLGRARTPGYMGAGLSLAAIAAVAGQGHAAAGVGWTGTLQLCGDALHLIAVGIWIGALFPLALLLQETLRAGAGAIAARFAAMRFSTLGLCCLVLVVATGLLNSWFLVGNIEALVETDYGHLLIAKLIVVAVLVTIAAYNRFRLVARIAIPEIGPAAVRLLARNAAVEAALGLVIIAIVAWLGTLEPAVHEFMHMG